MAASRMKAWISISAMALVASVAASARGQAPAPATDPTPNEVPAPEPAAQPAPAEAPAPEPAAQPAPTEEPAPEPEPGWQPVAATGSAQAATVYPPGAAQPQPEAASAAPMAAQPQPRDPNAEHSSFILAYQMAFPVADLHDYVSEPSFRGWMLTAEWPIVAGLRIGGAFQYSFFDEKKPRTTYPREDGAVTGTLYNYASAYAFSVLARYRFLRASSLVRPYVGVHLGMAFVSADTFIADFNASRAPEGFQYALEVGGVAKIGEQMIGSLAVRYDQSTASFFSVKNPGFVALQFGLGWEQD